jgi:hypothetical protein
MEASAGAGNPESGQNFGFGVGVGVGGGVGVAGCAVTGLAVGEVTATCVPPPHEPATMAQTNRTTVALRVSFGFIGSINRTSGRGREPVSGAAVWMLMRSLSLLLLFIVACGPSASGTPSPSATGPCPVTTPPPVAITPPPPAGSGPNPTLAFRPGPDDFLYGNDALIVNLANDGVMHPSDPSRGLKGGVKFAWWRIAPGDFVITTRRLDAPAVPLSADVPSGYGELGFQPSGLNFPSIGCWEVVGTVAGKTLTFVVNVAAR